MGAIIGLLCQVNWMMAHGPDKWPLRLALGAIAGWLLVRGAVLAWERLGRRRFWPGWQGFRQRLAGKRTVAGLLAAGLVMIYLGSMGGHFYSFDAWFRFLTTKSIVDQGSLIIDPIPGKLPPLVSKTGILQPILTIPFYIASKAVPQGSVPPPMDLKGPVDPDEMIASTMNQFTTPLIALVFFLMLVDWGYSRRVAFSATIVMALATIAWPYSRYYFSEPIMGLCLIISVWQMLRFRLRLKTRHLFYSGLALAVGAINTTVFLVAAVPLSGLYVAWLLWPRRGGVCTSWPQAVRLALVWAAPVFIAGCWVLWFNWYRFGGMFKTGYEGDQGFPNFIYDGRAGFSLASWVGLHGLLFSPGKSVFLFSPPLIAALLYMRGFFSRRRAESMLIALLCLGWLALYCKWWAWHGDIAWGPRYLVPVTFLAMLPLAQAFKLWPRRGLMFQSVLLFVILFGIVVQLLGIALHFELQFSAIVGPQQKDLPLLHYIPHYSHVMGNYRMLVMGTASPDFYLLGRPLGLILSVGGALCTGLAWLGAFTRRPGEAS